MVNFQKYEKYKDSGIKWLGMIPEHWELNYGRSCFYEKKVKNKGNHVKTVLSLSYGNIVIKPEDKLHGLVPESFETYQIVNPGDIIIRSTDLQNDKTSLRVGLVTNKGIITSAYLCLGTTQRINSQYAYYLLHSYDLLKIYYGMGAGVRQNLSIKDFKYLPVTLPPLEEQNRIAEFIDRKTEEIDRAIAHKKRLIELLEEQKTILINQAVTKGLNPNASMKDSGINWIGKIPKHWKIVKIKHLSNKITDGEHISPNIQNFGIPLLSAKDVRERFINFDNCAFISQKDAEKFWKRCKPENGDLLIVSRGATVGRVGLVETNQVFCLMGSVILIKPKNIVDSNFLYFSLNQQDVKNNITQISDASAQQAVYLIDVKETQISLPPLVEQIKISKNLNEETRRYEELIKKEELAIEKLTELKQILIAKAVTGKIKI